VDGFTRKVVGERATAIATRELIITACVDSSVSTSAQVMGYSACDRELFPFSESLLGSQGDVQQRPRFNRAWCAMTKTSSGIAQDEPGARSRLHGAGVQRINMDDEEQRGGRVWRRTYVSVEQANEWFFSTRLESELLRWAVKSATARFGKVVCRVSSSRWVARASTLLRGSPAAPDGSGTRRCSC
jgi:hypothetical protein